MSNLLRTVTLDSARRRKDKSVSLTFITSTEQTSQQFIEIDKLLDSSGVVFFKDSENISEEEISSLEATKIDVKVKGKSQSQKIRNKIWVLWNKQNTAHTKEEYYKAETDLILRYLQKKIDLLD
jgi:hypothetical protein